MKNAWNGLEHQQRLRVNWWVYLDLERLALGVGNFPHLQVPLTVSIGRPDPCIKC